MSLSPSFAVHIWTFCLLVQNGLTCGILSRRLDLLRFGFILVQIHDFHCFSWSRSWNFWLNCRAAGWVDLTHSFECFYKLHVVYCLDRLLLHRLVGIRLRLLTCCTSGRSTTYLIRCHCCGSWIARSGGRLLQNSILRGISDISRDCTTFSNRFPRRLTIIISIICWSCRTLLSHYIVHLILIKRTVEVRALDWLSNYFESLFEFCTHWALTVFARTSCQAWGTMRLRIRLNAVLSVGHGITCYKIVDTDHFNLASSCFFNASSNGTTLYSCWSATLSTTGNTSFETGVYVFACLTQFFL